MSALPAATTMRHVNCSGRQRGSGAYVFSGARGTNGPGVAAASAADQAHDGTKNPAALQPDFQRCEQGRESGLR
jgi:hypothetical protein